MIQCSNFVLLGAADRNVGKTEFACELIDRYSKTENVIGVKITTIKESDGACPRGGEGCGVCSSLGGKPYILTEEVSGHENKDTVRMLNAGAPKVYWLRVMQNRLKDGVKELLEQIPESACVICESNSVRTVLEPGVFIVIKQKGSDTIKSSCRKVMGHADTMVEFDNLSWDLQPGNVLFSNGQWSI